MADRNALVCKTEEMRAEFFLLHPKLKVIVCDADGWCKRHGIDAVWTSFYRTPLDDMKLGASGVHVAYRGADLRHFARAQDLADYINARYVYDANRAQMRTAWVHGDPIHIHFQAWIN